MSRRMSVTMGLRAIVLPLAALGVLLLAGAEPPREQGDSGPQSPLRTPSPPPQRGVEPTGFDATSQPSRRSRVEHGEYLVHHVAMCVKCHSPKSDDGAVVETEMLQGGTIPVQSPYPSQRWAAKAPRLAGLPGGWTAEQLATFLQTGVTPMGYDLRPPMPPFRMNEEDARAVAAYLDSLAP